MSLNVKAKMIIPVEESRGENICDLSLSKSFLGGTQTNDKKKKIVNIILSKLKSPTL